MDPEISRKLVSGFLNSGSPRFARASTAAAAAAAGGGGVSGNYVYTLYQCLFMVSLSEIKIKKK